MPRSGDSKHLDHTCDLARMPRRHAPVAVGSRMVGELAARHDEARLVVVVKEAIDLVGVGHENTVLAACESWRNFRCVGVRPLASQAHVARRTDMALGLQPRGAEQRLEVVVAFPVQVLDEMERYGYTQQAAAAVVVADSMGQPL